MSSVKICEKCGKRRATDRHHAIIPRSLFRGCKDGVLRQLVEDDINILYLCQDCHTGSGHISRKESFRIKIERGASKSALIAFQKVCADKMKANFPIIQQY